MARASQVDWLCMILSAASVSYCSYSGYMNCGTRTSKQMDLVSHLPCELHKENWCDRPGSLYPWHSIRNFLMDNQGLMRRMYGNIRQRSLLQDHFDDSFTILTSNDIPRRSQKVPGDLKVASRSQKSTGSSTTSLQSTALHTESSKENFSYQESTPSDDGVWTSEEVFATMSVLGEDSVTKTTEAFAKGEDYGEEAEEGIDNEILPDEEALFRESFPSVPPPIYAENTAEGMNACPAKEEVVAPYWSNNTRGEVLALLNLYPFEQYVHWEKCTYEHRQMFCRDGCRCEQQFRLHRMLAFDPSNECRGIFSDWFRYPSSCICRCYNITRNMYNAKEMTLKPDPLSQSDGGKSRQLSDDEREPSRPVELSINSFTYKIRGGKNFNLLLQHLSGKNKTDDPDPGIFESQTSSVREN